MAVVVTLKIWCEYLHVTRGMLHTNRKSMQHFQTQRKIEYETIAFDEVVGWLYYKINYYIKKEGCGS